MAVKKKKIVTSSYSNVSYDTTELYRKNDDAGRAVRFCGTRQEVYMYTLVMCAKLFVRKKQVLVASLLLLSLIIGKLLTKKTNYETTMTSLATCRIDA